MSVRRRRDRVALLAALLVLLNMMVALSSCGDSDLVFPGDLPATPTERPTATPEDEDA
jgi:hypothetical protein